MKDKHFTSRMLTCAGALMSISGILLAVCTKLAYGGILFAATTCMFFAARNSVLIPCSCPRPCNESASQSVLHPKWVSDEEMNPESSNAVAQEETASENTVPTNWEKATEDEPWKAALAEDLFAKYGVLPEYYEDLGDGIYQVYVEVGGKIVPFVTVNSATGDYRG